MASQDRGPIEIPSQGGVNKGNLGTDLLPTAGGIGGSLGGAALGASIGSIVPGIGTVIGGLAGGIIGGALGSGGGQVAKNAATGQKDLFKDVGQEALLGGIFSAPPIRLARGLGAVGKTVIGGTAKSTGKQAFEQAFIGAGKQGVRNAGQRTAQDFIGDATGIKAGRTLNGTRLTPQKMQTLQDFTLSTIKVPKTANAQQVFEYADNYSRTVGQRIGNTIKSIPANKVNIPGVGTTIATKLDSLIGTGGADNLVARDIKARLATAKTPEDLWNLKRELDSDLINYGRNPAGATPGAEKVARAATQEISSVLSKTSPELKQLNREYSQTQDIIDLASRSSEKPQGFNVPFAQRSIGGATGQSIKAGIGNTLQTGQAAIGKLPSFRSKVVGGAGGVTPTGGVPPMPPVGPSLGQPAGQYVRPSALYQAGGQFAFGSQNNQPTLDQALMQQSDSGQLGAQYAQDPTNPAFLGVDPAQFGYPEDQTTQASPYPRENLLYDIQRDPDNADKYIAYYQQVQEVFGPSEAPKSLSSVATKDVSNAQVGLQALDQIESILSQDPGVQQRGGVSGTFNPFGIASGALGTGEYENARAQARDVIARIRTGAALTNDEAKAFDKFLPQPGDDVNTVRSKLSYLRNQFQAIAEQQGGGSLQDALLAQQQGGGF